MRDNLILEGIAEDPSEDIEQNVRKFMVESMKFSEEKVGDISIDRIHRFGNSYSGKPRRVVAKFSYFKDKEEILSYSKNLKSSIDYN